MCSESCRQSLATSIAAGATEKNNVIKAGGCLLRLFIVILVVGFLKAGCSSSHKGVIHESKRVDQSTGTD